MASMCPHCGKLFARKNAVGLIPVHDGEEWDKGQCPGSEQAARNPESDRRPLWRDDPELHGRTATVKPTTRIDANGTEATEKPKGTIVRHPESLAMERTLKALAGLSLMARRRIVAHVHDMLEEEYAATMPQKGE